MRLSVDVHRDVLPNGLTVLAQRNSSAQVVAVVTHVKAGYFDEPDEWVGMSHVLEHMLFKGTAKRGPGEIARDTQLLGGYLNAGTSYEKTVYYTALPSSGDGLEKALEIQSDALKNSTLDADELARELEVIIQEAKRKLDSPNAVTSETLYELLFTKHRMRRWRIGKEEGLRQLTADDVRQYYTTRYTPGRVIVGIVGDIDVNRALELAKSAYGNWDRPTATVESSPDEPDGVNATARVMFGDVKRPLAVFGWRTVDALHKDTPALDVAASLLGYGRGARLYNTVRNPGLASSVGSGHFATQEVGVFNVMLAADAERLDDAAERSVEVVSDLIAHVPGENELGRVRALLAMRFARAFESMDSRATALCEMEAMGGYELVDELHQRTLAVTAEEVQRAANKHLHPQNASAVMYLPEAGASRLAGDAWPLQPRVGDQLEHPTQLPIIVDAPDSANVLDTAYYDGDIARRSFEGVDMLARSKRGCGLVSLGLDVVDLPTLETSANAGISRLLARSTVRGAGGMTGEELAQAAESLGGGIVASSSADGLGWGISVPPESLRNAAELLRKVALEPTLAAADVAKERSLQASDARRAQDDMLRYPLQRVLAKAFAGDPYGLPQLGEPEIVEALTAADVREWGGAVGSHRAVVVAVGDLEQDELLDALMPLAAWPAANEHTASVKCEVDFNEDSGFERRDKAQSALAMAFPAVPATSPDRFAVAVMGSMLSGLAGRLFEELRENRSLAYTVFAIPWLRRRAGALLTYIATSPDRESEACEQMLKELDRLVKEMAPEDEIERASNYSAGLVEMRQQNASAVASDILSAWLHGGLDDLTRTADRLRAVSAEDVAQVAADVFESGRRATYVVHGTGKVG